jgi:hypothetical protein
MIGRLLVLDLLEQLLKMKIISDSQLHVGQGFNSCQVYLKTSSNHCTNDTLGCHIRVWTATSINKFLDQ